MKTKEKLNENYLRLSRKVKRAHMGVKCEFNPHRMGSSKLCRKAEFATFKRILGDREVLTLRLISYKGRLVYLYSVGEDYSFGLMSERVMGMIFDEGLLKFQ